MTVPTTRPAPSARREIALTLTALATVAMLLAVLAGWVRADHYAGAWGVSAGTDTRYCSAEITAHGPALSCQAGH
jgi:hypothetical protein